MKVLFLEDVPGVAQGGEVKTVKPGFARNFLIPKRFATPVTADALQRVDRLKRQAEENRVRVLKDMRALSDQVNGIRINVEMRSGASGRLYGSVTNGIVADELSKVSGSEIDRRVIELGGSIRRVGNYDLRLRFHSEVEANIKLLVHPIGTDPEEFLKSLEEDVKPVEESDDSGKLDQSAVPEEIVSDQVSVDSPQVVEEEASE